MSSLDFMVFAKIIFSGSAPSSRTVFISFALLWGAFKKLLQWALTLIINSAIGLIMLYTLNFLGLGVPITPITIGIIAVFGLPAVAILAMLAFFGAI